MPRPIILIHGACHGGWCFEAVTAILQTRGYSTIAPDLPFTGQQDDIDAARDAIASHPDAVVLGHSYGGAVISHAAIDAAVHRLVFLCAFMPDQGETLLGLQQQFPPSRLAAAMTIENGLLGFDPEEATAALYQDCGAEAATEAIAKLRRMVLHDLPDFSAPPAWRATASTYVLCEADQALHPELQSHFAARAQDTVRWSCGHSPFISEPERLADLLADYAG